jgi:TolA-binding protein
LEATNVDDRFSLAPDDVSAHYKRKLVMIRLNMMFVVLGLLLALGCEQKPVNQTPGKVTSEDVRRDAGQAVETAGEYSQQAKDEFQTKLEAQLAELDGRIAKLREKSADLKDEAKVNWDKTMADLETKREAARVKLAEVGQSSGEAWKDVQKGAQAAWDDLDKAFRDASTKF